MVHRRFPKSPGGLASLSAFPLSPALEHNFVPHLSFPWVSQLIILVAPSDKMRALAHSIKQTRGNSADDSFPVYVLDPDANAEAVLYPSVQATGGNLGESETEIEAAAATASVSKPGPVSSKAPHADEQVRNASFTRRDKRSSSGMSLE